MESHRTSEVSGTGSPSAASSHIRVVQIEGLCLCDVIRPILDADVMIHSGEGHQAGDPKDDDEDEDEDIYRHEEGQGREDASDDESYALKPRDDPQGPESPERIDVLKDLPPVLGDENQPPARHHQGVKHIPGGLEVNEHSPGRHRAQTHHAEQHLDGEEDVARQFWNHRTGQDTYDTHATAADIVNACMAYRSTTTLRSCPQGPRAWDFPSLAPHS